MALTAWQQQILNQSRSNGGQGTIQEMLSLAGYSLSPENIAGVQKLLGSAGETAPVTMAEVAAGKAREATAAGQIKPLTEYQQKEYDNAVRMGMTAADVAGAYNSTGYPLRETEVNDILAGAGLKLGGAKPTKPALNPMPPEFNGGMPGRQPDGMGMYGGTTIMNINTPGNQMPQQPQLRSIWAAMRRRSQPGWKGQTDRIITGARGLDSNALIKKRVLTGS